MGSAAGGPGQAPPGLNVWFAGSFFLGLSLWFPSYLLYLPLMPASMVFPPAAPLFLYPLGSPGAPPLDPVGGAAPGPRWGRRPPRSSQRSLRVAAKAASFNSLAHWASASLLPPLAALGSRSSQRSLRVAAKAASFNSLAHWASASLFPPLAALGSAPLPLLKKAGENQLEYFC